MAIKYRLDTASNIHSSSAAAHAGAAIGVEGPGVDVGDIADEDAAEAPADRRTDGQQHALHFIRAFCPRRPLLTATL